MHSIRHIISIVLELDEANFSNGIKLFIKKALPLTIITAILYLLAVFFISNFYGFNTAIMQVIFIGLASLTFPHILLEYLIEKMKQKIKIFLAAPRGFCAGVDRAIEIVKKTLNKYGSPVYVRHEIVHNKNVVENLKI